MRAGAGECALYCLCSSGSDGEASLSPGLGKVAPRPGPFDTRRYVSRLVYVSMYARVCVYCGFFLYRSPRKRSVQTHKVSLTGPFSEQMAPAGRLGHVASAGRMMAAVRSGGEILPLHQYICSQKTQQRCFNEFIY